MVNISGVSEINDSGKKKILLLKGKEKEIPHVSADLFLQKRLVHFYVPMRDIGEVSLLLLI